VTALPQPEGRLVQAKVLLADLSYSSEEITKAVNQDPRKYIKVSFNGNHVTRWRV
jgi:hypothetical protein